MEKDKFEKSEIKGMFKGPLPPVIIRLAVPILAGMVFQLLYTIVDTAFINFIDSKNPAIIGGTGYIFPISFVAMALSNGLAVGMSALVAKGIGEKDNKIVYKTAESGLFIALVLSVFVFTVVYLFDEEIVYGLGATGEYFKYALEYLQYILPVTAFMFFGSVLGGILQGEGLMNKFMKSMIIGTVLNIILDPFFIFGSIDLKLFILPGLGLGVKGAALATVIGQGFSVLYLFTVFVRKQTLVIIEWKLSHISPAIMKRIIKIGFPQSFGQLIMSVAFLFMNKIATYIDPIIVTSSSLVGRMEQLVYMPMFAIAAASITIAGQNVGRKNMERVESTWKTGIIMSSATVMIISGLYYIFAPQIYGAFQQTASVTAYAIKQTRVTMPFMLISSMVIITRSIYQAIGYPIPGLVITALRFFIIVIPVMYILVYPFNLGFEGILYAHIISICGTAIIAWLWMKNTMTKLKAGTLKTI